MTPQDDLGQDLARLDGVPTADPSYRLSFRAGVARREMPWLLGMWAIAFAAVTALHMSTGELGLRSAVIGAGVLVVAVLVAWVIRQRWCSDVLVGWAYALTLGVMALQFQWDYAEHGHPTELALSVLVVATIGPLTASWPPFLSVAAICLLFQWGVASESLGATLAAFGMSGVLMAVRIRSLDRQADITVLANRLATSDVVTGLLNGHGLARTLPRLEATAKRLVQPVMVMHLDITPAPPRVVHSAAHEAGLRTIASVINATVRADDLVARLSDHTFLVVGLGTRGDGASMAHRLVTGLREAGIPAQEWSGDIRYSIVSDLLNLTDLPTLIAEARSEGNGAWTSTS